MEKDQGKSKEQILAERQAKKAAKKNVKKNEGAKEEVKPEKPSPVASPQKKPQSPVKLSSSKEQVQSSQVIENSSKEPEKSRDQVKAEREAKKLAKQAAKKKTDQDPKTQVEKTPEPLIKTAQIPKQEIKKTNSDVELAVKMENLHITDVDTSKKDEQNQGKGKPTSKAERRAIQEAQRAAKAKQQQEKLDKQAAVQKKASPVSEQKPKEAKQEHKIQKSPNSSSISQKSSALHKVRLFKHLYTEKCDLRIKANSQFHPAIVKLGAQYGNDTIVGSNARCYAFLNAMKTVSENGFVTVNSYSNLNLYGFEI